MIMPVAMQVNEVIQQIRDFERAHGYGRRVLWGLDFDGTLAALRPNPEAVKLSREGLGIVERLASCRELAIISGRGLNDLRSRLPISALHFATNHGAEIERRGGKLWQWSSAQWSSWRQRRLWEISELAETHGGRVEDKGLSLAVHFRHAQDHLWWETQAPGALGALLDEDTRLMEGAACWNIIPTGAPNKGTAALRLCLELGCEGIVYFGDEPTDENVFTLTELPVLGIKVGHGTSAARCRLESPEQVLEVLRQIV